MDENYIEFLLWKIAKSVADLESLAKSKKKEEPTMKEYENVRDALKDLEVLNNPKTTFGTVKEDGKERPWTLKDLQEQNWEILSKVCDLLGMSSVYLDDNIEFTMDYSKDKGVIAHLRDTNYTTSE